MTACAGSCDTGLARRVDMVSSEPAETRKARPQPLTLNRKP